MLLNFIILENSQTPSNPNNDIRITYDSLETRIAETKIKTYIIPDKILLKRLLIL